MIAARHRKADEQRRTQRGRRTPTSRLRAEHDAWKRAHGGK